MKKLVCRLLFILLFFCNALGYSQTSDSKNSFDILDTTVLLEKLALVSTNFQMILDTIIEHEVNCYSIDTSDCLVISIYQRSLYENDVDSMMYFFQLEFWDNKAELLPEYNAFFQHKHVYCIVSVRGDFPSTIFNKTGEYSLFHHRIHFDDCAERDGPFSIYGFSNKEDMFYLIEESQCD